MPGNSLYRRRSDIYRRVTKRTRKLIGTKVPLTTKLQATHVGAEVVVAQTPTVRATHVGVEVLVSYPLPPVTTKFVSHIYEDYV